VIAGTLSVTIRCLRDVQEVLWARLIDAKGYRERNRNPWDW
jgi:hypothetical protein